MLCESLLSSASVTSALAAAIQQRLEGRANLIEDVVDGGGDEAAVDIEQHDGVYDGILSACGAQALSHATIH